MDTELARTFLAVVDTGSFGDAAARLHVTQSTVSSRIQRLEDTLGAALFVRNKSGASLTAAGRQFQRHASLLTRTVEQARHEIGVASGFRASLTVAARFGLWEGLLLDWIATFRVVAPDVGVRAIMGFGDELMAGLVDGRIDVALLYTPQARPGLTIEPLLEERLVMVSSRKDVRAAPGRDYVYVDWGPEFHAHHSKAFPDYAGSGLSVNMGWLGLQHLLAGGGAGYFPARLTHALELAGRLHRVADAPDFRLPAYLCFATKMQAEPLALALDTIRRVAADA
ncbi:MAG: HTH-type transcriptional regulator HdfR [Steroidobacteraceae bacterium]|nr:HTH-type transcriptional regulator HdfR [Steroidobacteraceae bacterium]